LSLSLLKKLENIFETFISEFSDNQYLKKEKDDNNDITQFVYLNSHVNLNDLR
jgi:glutathione peroxidase-family protein